MKRMLHGSKALPIFIDLLVISFLVNKENIESAVKLFHTFGDTC